jgi:hypothetical protein
MSASNTPWRKRSMPAEISTDAVWCATIAAALLRRGAMVHRASFILTIAALLTGVAMAIATAKPGTIWLAVGPTVVGLGVVEFWLAGRVAIDADLFAAIAAKDADLGGFDRAMQALGLMPPHKAGRPVEARVRGAMRLLKLQGLALAAQLAAPIAGALMA